MDNNNIQEIQEQIRSGIVPLTAIRREAARFVSGQKDLIERLLSALLANGHVLLEGVPGLAKTLAVKTLAGTVNGTFSRIQFTPDLLPSDVIGTRIYHAATGEFQVKPGPVRANIVLADEINRAPAKVQSALLEAMQERQITIGQESFALPSPFLVLATQNPIEQEGTYPLPEAQLDRFMYKLLIDYPSREEEKRVIEMQSVPQPEFAPQAVASVDDILKLRELVGRVYVDDKILEYILDIVIATRPAKNQRLSPRQDGVDLSKISPLVGFGSSPRGSIALALAARTQALLDGRAYVLPEDVKSVACDTLRHRIVLSYEAEAENVSADEIISGILDLLRIP